MPHDFIPRPEAKLLEWSKAFSTQLNIDPESLGISIDMAAQYSALHASYAAMYKAANENISRGPSSILAKNQAKKALVAEARRLARIIRANPDVTDSQRQKLGLTIPDPHATAVNEPAQPPQLRVTSTAGRQVSLFVRARHAKRRGKPKGTVGAMILTYVGEEPPTDLDEWTFCCNATRPRFVVDVPGKVPALSKLWFTARWLSTRLEPGPPSTPEHTYITGGLAKVGA